MALNLGNKDVWLLTFVFTCHLCIPRKEVIQPQLPLRLPCYDFAPVIDPTLGACLLAVSSATSGVSGFHSVTGGVYKARERIHRRVLTGGY